MARGLYRDEDTWVMVDYGAPRAPIHRRTYEEADYEPSYDKLPTKQEFEESERRDLIPLSSTSRRALTK